MNKNTSMKTEFRNRLASILDSFFSDYDPYGYYDATDCHEPCEKTHQMTLDTLDSCYQSAVEIMDEAETDDVKCNVLGDELSALLLEAMCVGISIDDIIAA